MEAVVPWCGREQSYIESSSMVVVKELDFIYNFSLNNFTIRGAYNGIETDPL